MYDLVRHWLRPDFKNTANQTWQPVTEPQDGIQMRNSRGFLRGRLLPENGYH